MRVITDNAIPAMLEGMRKAVDIIKLTMGPKGRNIVIEEGGQHTFTNDGVTVAKHIELQDKVENIGASMIIEACEKANRQAGDGTTSTAVLTYAIAKEGYELTQKGMNPFMLAKALRDVSQKMIEIIRSQSQPISTKEQIQQIATISSQDDDIGLLIATAMDEVGENGTITIQEGSAVGVSYEIKKGMELNQGYLSPYFVNRENNECHIGDPMILVTDINIQSFKQIKPLFEKFLTNPSTKDKNLVIICPEIEPEPLASIVANKLAGAIKCVVIKAPGYGDQRTELLKDIAVLTGATFISDEAGASLEQCDTLHLGTADKIQSTETTTTIIDGAGDQIAIQDRAESIKQKMAQADNDFLKTKLQERVSKLIGGIAIIRVGANTEMEMKNKKFKIEDALNATRSAMEEGIVDGAGMALAWTAIPRMDMPADEYTILAQSILDQAKVYPSKQIITNAGYEADEILAKTPLGEGYNSKTGEYCNLVEAGVIDPVKVIRCALENAVSSATMLLTTQASITHDEKNS